MATFGETLKRERELRKISLREVSEATKIGLRYLEALEANRFDQLPGGLFNKGFIRAYAKFIGLDGEAMVNAYLFDLNGQQHPQPPRPRYAGFSIEEAAPPVAPPEKPAPAPSRRWILAGFGGAALLAAVAAGLWFAFFRGPSSPPSAPPPAAVEEEKAQILGETSGAPAQAGLEAPAPASNETRDSVPSAPAATSAEAPASESPAPATGEVPLAGTVEETEGPGPEPEFLSLVISFSETTWIAVHCGESETLNKIIPAGETVRLSCREEIRLDSGNAGAMMVRINGNDCLPLGERSAVIHEVFDRNRAKELCPPPPSVEP